MFYNIFYLPILSHLNKQLLNFIFRDCFVTTNKDIDNRMFVCALAQLEEYKKYQAGEYVISADGSLAIYQVFFLCMLSLNSVETGTKQDENIQVTSHESDARDYLEQAAEICYFGIVSKHTFFM